MEEESGGAHTTEPGGEGSPRMMTDGRVPRFDLDQPPGGAAALNTDSSNQSQKQPVMSIAAASRASVPTAHFDAETAT